MPWRAWLSYQNRAADGTFKATKRNAAAYLNALTQNGDVLTERVIRDFAEGTKKPKGEGSKTLVSRAKRFATLKDKFGDVEDDAAAYINCVFDIDQWMSESSEDEVNVVADDMRLVREKALSLLSEVKQASDAPPEPVEQLRKVTQRLRYDIAVREPFAVDGKVDVQVTTFWSAKGVTANHVYVLGLTEETIPGTKRDEYPGTELDYHDEQRRLFYVSMTRSKNTLVLSRSSRIKRNDAQRLGLSGLSGNGPWVLLKMSPFLRDIKGYLPQIVPGETWQGCLPKAND